MTRDDEQFDPANVADGTWYRAKHVGFVHGPPINDVRVRFRGHWLDLVIEDELASFPAVLVTSVHGISGVPHDSAFSVR